MSYNRKPERISLQSASAEELNQFLLDNPHLNKANQVKIQERLLVIKLRDLVNDEHWNDLGLTGTIFPKNPDSIKQYRKILNNTDISDHKKLLKIRSIANSKKENDIAKPEHSSMDNEDVKKRRDLYWKLKRMIGRSVGVIYTNWKVLNPQEINDGLDDIQKNIYTTYERDKGILTDLKSMVDDEIFWANKGRKDFVYRNDHDFTPKCITDVRTILATNTTSQKDKFKALEEVLKTYKPTQKDSPEVQEFMKRVPTMIKNKSTESIRRFNELNEKRLYAGTLRRNSAQDILLDLSIALNNPKWKTKGEAFIGTKTPDGIKQAKKILNGNYPPEVKLEKIFMLMQAKTKEHRNRDKSLFSKNPDTDVKALYQQIVKLSTEWHGHQRQKNNSLTKSVKEFETNNNISNRVI